MKRSRGSTRLEAWELVVQFVFVDVNSKITQIVEVLSSAAPALHQEKAQFYVHGGGLT